MTATLEDLKLLLVDQKKLTAEELENLSALAEAEQLKKLSTLISAEDLKKVFEKRNQQSTMLKGGKALVDRGDQATNEGALKTVMAWKDADGKEVLPARGTLALEGTRKNLRAGLEALIVEMNTFKQIQNDFKSAPDTPTWGGLSSTPSAHKQLSKDEQKIIDENNTRADGIISTAQRALDEIYNRDQSYNARIDKSLMFLASEIKSLADDVHKNPQGWGAANSVFIARRNDLETVYAELQYTMKNGGVFTKGQKDALNLMNPDTGHLSILKKSIAPLTREQMTAVGDRLIGDLDEDIKALSESVKGRSWDTRDQGRWEKLLERQKTLARMGRSGFFILRDSWKSDDPNVRTHSQTDAVEMLGRQLVRLNTPGGFIDPADASVVNALVGQGLPAVPGAAAPAARSGGAAAGGGAGAGAAGAGAASNPVGATGSGTPAATAKPSMTAAEYAAAQKAIQDRGTREAQERELAQLNAAYDAANKPPVPGIKDTFGSAVDGVFNAVGQFTDYIGLPKGLTSWAGGAIKSVFNFAGDSLQYGKEKHSPWLGILAGVGGLFAGTWASGLLSKIPVLGGILGSGPGKLVATLALAGLAFKWANDYAGVGKPVTDPSHGANARNGGVIVPVDKSAQTFVPGVQTLALEGGG